MTTEGLDAEVRLTPIRLPIDPDANFPSRAIVQKKLVHLPDWSLHQSSRTRTQSASKVGRQLVPLPAAVARARMHRPARVCGKSAQKFRRQGYRSGRILPRSGIDRNRERAPLPRNAGGAGAADRDVRNFDASSASRRPMRGPCSRASSSPPCGCCLQLAAVQLCDGGSSPPPATATRRAVHAQVCENADRSGANFPSRAIVSKEELYLAGLVALDLPEFELGSAMFSA